MAGQLPKNHEEITDFAAYLKDNGSLTYWNRGVSMRPLIRQERDHFTLVPKPEGRCKKYDVVLYRRKNGAYVMHRILKVRDKDYGIRGDNTYRMEYGITDADILGVMTEFSRDGGKWIPVTDPGYLFYVRAWCALYPLRWCYVKARRLGGKILRRLGLKK